MEKFKVMITEVLVGEIEIEANDINEAKEMIKQGHEESGKMSKPLNTESMYAEIYIGENKNGFVRLI